MRQERKSSGFRIRGKILVLFFSVMIAVLFTRVVSEWRKHNDIQDEIARLRAEAERLEGRNLEILELSRELTTEEFLEREARLKLGLQRPGESVLMFGSSQGAEEAEQKAAPLGASRRANARNWWYYFFDHKQFKALREERNARLLHKPKL